MDAKGREPEDGYCYRNLMRNKGLTMWATQDAVSSQAMCRVYIDWI